MKNYFKPNKIKYKNNLSISQPKNILNISEKSNSKFIPSLPINFSNLKNISSSSHINNTTISSNTAYDTVFNSPNSISTDDNLSNLKTISDFNSNFDFNISNIPKLNNDFSNIKNITANSSLLNSTLNILSNYDFKTDLHIAHSNFDNFNDFHNISNKDFSFSNQNLIKDNSQYSSNVSNNNKVVGNTDFSNTKVVSYNDSTDDAYSSKYSSNTANQKIDYNAIYRFIINELKEEMRN